MHPIKALNQAIPKVLKLKLKLKTHVFIEPVVSFAFLEKSQYFSHLQHQVFVLLCILEEGVEGNQRAEQRGKNKDFRCHLSPGRCWLREAQAEEISSDHLLIFTLNSPLICLCPEEGHSVETKE